jgi:FAD/FMN-containing dehydrogenase
MGRRSFLGVAGAGAVSGAALLATGCNGTSPAAAAARTTATGADWTALAHDLSGRLVRPGDSAYAVAHRLFDPRFDSIHPVGIAYCHNSRDVATCIAFARKYGVPVAARSGGHSYAGWSSTTGLIVDVSQMSGVRVSGGSATVGAGTRLIDMYGGLAEHGRVVPGGSCPTVGIAGLAMGGGVGMVGRAYGLTCDNLESVQMVTADGSVLDADAKTHSDLYWACRGGGGGNFGIATQFTFRTHPAGDVVYFFLSWPWSQAAALIRGWQSWAPHAPDALWSNMHLSAAPVEGAGEAGGGTPTIEVGGTYLGSISGAHNQLERLYAAAGSEPSSYFLNSASFMHVMLVMAGCASLGEQACHLPTQVPGGRLSRQPQFAKSDYFARPLSDAGIGTVLRNLEALRSVRGAKGGVGGIAFDALGGAINRVRSQDTAFVHRTSLFQAQYTTDWIDGAARGVDEQHQWLRSFWRHMRPYASGEAYQNYIDPDLTDWRQAYYGANYSRLSQVKKAYDPHRLFTFPQAI